MGWFVRQRIGLHDASGSHVAHVVFRIADAVAVHRRKRYVARTGSDVEYVLIASEQVETGLVKRKHIFLSYIRENAPEVLRLRSDLVAAGEEVWWDQDIIAGQDWRLDVTKAMRSAYAVLVCLSGQTAARITSGQYPELRDAIDAYRQYPPGSIFLIPVRLSDCEIPTISIDGTQMLDGLQYVDLWPSSSWGAGVAKLITAVRGAPHHP
jgi:TIR domain